MKFLGWMRHKFRESCKEPFEETTTGNYHTGISVQAFLAAQDTNLVSIPRSKYNASRLMRASQPYEPSIYEFISETVDGNPDEGPTVAVGEFFHGFLAIGTLGSEPNGDEPATPTFGILPEAPAEETTEVREKDLNLINEELDKFLEAEAEEWSKSSGRKTNISYKLMAGVNDKETKSEMQCPLQAYLFGSSMELPAPKVEAKKERASLGELFERTKMEDKILKENYENCKLETKPTLKSAKHLATKMLKKFHASSKTYSALCKNEPHTTKQKFQRVFQLFQKKVHPEECIAGEFNESCNLRISKTLSTGSYPTGERLCPDKDGLHPKGRIVSHEANPKWKGPEPRGASSAGKMENWIKTDANYLVLEL